MISVIVPVYKVEKYLRKCVESIQNQTYKDLEIILVDDGSPDNSGKICDELREQDNRILVIHQQNVGLAGARNAGLAQCQGEFVAFVDSDDTIEPNMYQIMLETMDDNCDLVICGYRVVKEGQSLGIQKNFIPQRLTEDELWDEVFGRLNNSACNKLYRREIIGELRFPVGIIHGEDLIFNLNYLSRCSAGVINETQLYNYLKREDSITTARFNRKKLMEITSKDLAREIVGKWKPEQLQNANKFCFRARMNVLRSIFNVREENDYYKEVLSYKDYVKHQYSIVKNQLRFKERVEFFFFVYCIHIYKIFTRYYW